LSGGRYQDVYVHAKAALVDDAWATIGSTNVASRSFYADTELNASLWDPGTARALRAALFREHLGVDTAASTTARRSPSSARSRARTASGARAASACRPGLRARPARYGAR